MKVETELRRATDLLARIICKRIDALELNDTFQAKELKELTGIVKDLSSIERSLTDEENSSDIKVIFEGGDTKWAQ